MANTNLILFQLDDFPEVVSGAKTFEGNENIEVFETKNLIEISSILEMNSSGVLVYTVRSKEDFQKLVEIFKTYSTQIKEGKIKLALMQLKKNSKVESISRKFGCSDFLDSTLNEKSFCFKVDFWTSTILNTLGEEPVSPMSVANSSRPKASEASSKKGEVRQVAPIQGEKLDIWFAPENNCKKVLTKWLISMHGPSPHIASWVDCGDSVWKFVIDEAKKDSFYLTEGNWFFRGLKPEFNWKDKIWNFSANEPELYFKVESQNEKRIYIKEGDLYICKNSRNAILLKKKILASAESTFSIQRNTKAPDPDSENFNQDNKIETKMGGETSTDKLGGHYSGEQKKSEAGDNLSGELKSAADKTETQYSFDNKDAQKATKALELALDDTTESKDYSLDTMTEQPDVIVRLSSKDSNETYLCIFEDLFETQLSVAYKKAELPMNKELLVTVTLDYGSQNVSINTTGEAKEKEDGLYTLEIKEIEAESLDSFMRLYEKRQDQILEFLKMAKGY